MLAEQVLINCSRKCQTYLADAVKSLGVSLDRYSDVVALICEGAFSDLKQKKAVAPNNEVSSLTCLYLCNCIFTSPT